MNFMSFLLILTKFSFCRGDGTLGYHSVWFTDFPDVSWFPKIRSVNWQFVRQALYTMFISTNRASFHLWWEENSVKHQNVSKCENGCLQNFPLLLMSFLIVLIAKTTLPTLWTQWKDRRSRKVSLIHRCHLNVFWKGSILPCPVSLYQ